MFAETREEKERYAMNRLRGECRQRQRREVDRLLIEYRDAVISLCQSQSEALSEGMRRQNLILFTDREREVLRRLHSAIDTL